MGRLGTEPKEDTLLKRLEECERFNIKLIQALKVAEIKLQKALEDKDIYLLPDGTYHGEKI